MVSLHVYNLYFLYGFCDLKCFFFDFKIELDSFCKYEHLLVNELKEKTVVKMKFVVYHEGIFYMRDKLFGRPFSLLNSMIKEYCGLNLHSYLPHIGEVCLGQFPGFYYIINNTYSTNTF